MADVFDPDKYRQHLDANKQASEKALVPKQSTDPETQKAIDQPGLMGTVGRTLGGFVQGELDPLEGAGSLAGIDVAKGVKKLDPTDYEAIAKTPAGRAGRVAGNVLNPAWEAGKAIDALQAGARFGGPIIKGLQHIAANAMKGAGAGAVMPGEDRNKQAEVGGSIGAVLGLPKGLATVAGFPGVGAAVRYAAQHIPFVDRVLDAGRSLSIPDFNRVWNDYVLKPIGGKAPPVAGRESMKNVRDQVGRALDTSTVGMSFDAPAGSPALNNLSREFSNSVVNLSGTSSPAGREFARTIRDVWFQPLSLHQGGRLTSAELQTMASNLKDRIDAIRPFSAENRALRRELENFRHSIFDNATGTPAQKAAYQNARQAYQRFAIGRDASPDTAEGFFTPDDLMKELSTRYPLRTPLGTAPHQDVVGAGQSALLFPGRAAATAAAGNVPLSRQIAPLVVPGAAGTGARNWQPGGSNASQGQ